MFILNLNLKTGYFLNQYIIEKQTPHRLGLPDLFQFAGHIWNLYLYWCEPCIDWFGHAWSRLYTRICHTACADEGRAAMPHIPKAFSSSIIKHIIFK